MSRDYISLDEAERRSGLHRGTLRRLLRQGTLVGHKAYVNGRVRWMVSVISLWQYTDPVYGFLLGMSGPKLFLRRLKDGEDED